MNEKFTLKGGARIGMANATYPWADLFVDKDILKINASLIGKLIFRPEDIISIEPYSIIPFLGQGIKINHRVKNYNSKVIFWTLQKPEIVINEIEKVGFFERINSEISLEDEEIIKMQQQGSFPIKKSIAIIFVVLWNLLFLSDFILFFQGVNKDMFPFGNGIKMAIGLVMITSILTLISSNFRAIILKEGRDINEIKQFIYFLIVICGFMLLSFTNIVFDTK